VPSLDPCTYRQHRPYDWRLPHSRVPVCGICHPPPPALTIHQRDTTVEITRADVVLARLQHAKTRHDL
jgi:hypothetical protein